MPKQDLRSPRPIRRQAKKAKQQWKRANESRR